MFGYRHGRARRAFLGVLVALGVCVGGPGAGSALAAAPVCNPNSYTVANTATLELPGDENCTDADGDPMTAFADTLPTNGWLTSNGSGGAVYHPNTGYVGPDSFTFHVVANGELSNVETISITVTGTASNQAPLCVGTQNVQAFEGRVTNVSVSCFDPDGNPLTGTIVTQAQNGDAAFSGSSLTYAADDEYIGPDSFSYKVNDGTVDSTTVDVTVDVADYPEGNQPPTCPQTNVFVETGSSIRLTGNCVDPEHDPIFYAPGNPFTVNGSFSDPTGDSVLFHPASGFTGLAALNYTVRDAYHDPVEFHVPIHVLPVGTPCCESAPEATPEEPYAASVASPVPGGIYIDTRPTSVLAPTGFALLNQEFDIHAPDAIDPDDPLTFVFKLDGAELAAQQVAAQDVRMIRDGDPIHDTCPAPGARTGDWWPCEQSRSEPNGDLWITVLTMQASVWNVGVSDAPPDADSDGVPTAPTTVSTRPIPTSSTPIRTGSAPRATPRSSRRTRTSARKTAGRRSTASTSSRTRATA